MNGPDFERFQANAQDCGVLFYYAGEFTPAVVAAAADSLKQRLATEDASGPAKRKLFSTFVEMAHNILHYAVPPEEGGVAPLAADAATGPKGAIGVGKDLPEGGQEAEAAPQYWIVCSNAVDVAHVPRLTDKLDALRAMSLEEIKQSYREQLRNPDHNANDTLSKGAGLGLLTIARDASAPLEYSFAPSPDTEGRTALFHVKARI
ncbi:hypothetical protein PMI14_02108 [Acidovorax sp. CF316]|uniref:SiaB family protein kinase n=1 Tax=Acidovorax sp. CF316 TaxID=1144317 RepID=UPI00026BE1B8|nr:SiaB family protein kinase [Acidovorax sp. CF316]EJE53209.1 hypothetical protein PMI14_02108 [Acidovorax sp. CF316]